MDYFVLFVQVKLYCYQFLHKQFTMGNLLAFDGQEKKEKPQFLFIHFYLVWGIVDPFLVLNMDYFVLFA